MTWDAKEIDELFQAALERPAGPGRQEWLQQICEDRPEILARLKRLLEASEKAGEFLESPVIGRIPVPRVSDSSKTRREIGNYKLLEEIGCGGMGIVYLAEQLVPVRRQVALKLIRPGLDTEQVIARFEAERQALALMDHPNIARVLDAGTTDDERPYFVMELVRGVPITTYCDAHHLTARERLALFIPVCQAIQHAHQKGIIHRDLKPSNILVARFDDHAVPKVIDFGVAKATNQELTNKTLWTGFGTVVGTVEYMSPEQASLNQLDVDTRSDIYSLGIVLYELLAGSPPFSRHELEKVGMLEMLRCIREQEPTRPSAKLSTSEMLGRIAADRSADPKQLTALLRGELDWIILKAVHKKREHRYETASDLAADIRRFLGGEAIQAVPLGTMYQLSKFIRKHRGQVLAATMILIVLIAGIFGTTWGMFRALDAEFLANRRLEQADVARKEAVDATVRERIALEAVKAEADEKTLALKAESQQKQYAQAVADFVIYDVLALTSVEGQGRFGGDNLARDAKLRTLLDNAAGRIATRNLDPQVAAKLYWIIGISYRAVGASQQSLQYLQKSAELYTSILGPRHELTINSRHSLGIALNANGLLDEAASIQNETLATLRSISEIDKSLTLNAALALARTEIVRGNADIAQMLFDESIRGLSQQYGNSHESVLLAKVDHTDVLELQGRPAEALSRLQALVQESRLALGEEHFVTLTAESKLAMSLNLAHRESEARELMEQNVRVLTERLGDDHPATLVATSNLALILQAVGDGPKALPMLEKVASRRREILGEQHPDFLVAQMNLADAMRRAGQATKAVTSLQHCRTEISDQLGEDHPLTLVCMNHLATALQDADRLPDAMAVIEDTILKRSAVLGATHPDTLTSIARKAQLLILDKRGADAIPLLEHVRDTRRQVMGNSNADTIIAMCNLAVGYRITGRPNDAIAVLDEALPLAQTTLGATHTIALSCLNNVAVAYWNQGRLDKSVPMFEEVVRLRSAGGSDESDVLMAYANLGTNYGQVGRIDEAIAMLRKADAKRRQRPEMKWVRSTLRRLCIDAHRTDELLTFINEDVSFARETFGSESAAMLECLSDCGWELLNLGHPESAEPLLREASELTDRLQPTAWAANSTRVLLGTALLQLDRPDEAIPMLIESVEGFRKHFNEIPEQNRHCFTYAMQALVQYYERSGNDEQRRRWLQELNELTGAPSLPTALPSQP